MNNRDIEIVFLIFNNIFIKRDQFSTLSVLFYNILDITVLIKQGHSVSVLGGKQMHSQFIRGHDQWLQLIGMINFTKMARFTAQSKPKAGNLWPAGQTWSTNRPPHLAHTLIVDNYRKGKISETDEILSSNGRPVHTWCSHHWLSRVASNESPPQKVKTQI